MPFINAIEDPFLTDALISRDLSIGKKAAMQPSAISFRPNDVIYVPVLTAGELERYRESGGYPANKGIVLVRYTFVKRDRTTSRLESDKLYPWREHCGKNKPRDGQETRLKQLAQDNREKLPLLDPGKVFFTADTHFFDTRILKYRPAFQDVFEMNDELVRLWNEAVPPDGIVFHLGDFSMGTSELTDTILRCLNGTVLLIKGNHDDLNVTGRLSARKLGRFVYLGMQRRITVDGQRIDLNHYPFLCYAGEYRGVWQLFGHVHSTPDGGGSGHDVPRMRYLLPGQYDVGVDNNSFRPVSFLELRRIMETRDCSSPDGEADMALEDEDPDCAFV